MSEVFNWNETPAALLLNQGITVEAPGEARAREFYSAEARSARIGFAAALAADPSWQAARAAQEELAERGMGPSAWIHIGDTTPPELRGLYLAEKAREARTGTWGPSGPTNDFAVEIEQHERERAESARLRMQVQNRMLPPGSPR